MRLLEEQGIGVYRIGMVGDRASKGQAATVYGAGFAAGSLAGKGARGVTRGTGNNVSYDNELMEVGRMAEGDQGRVGKKVVSGYMMFRDPVYSTLTIAHVY